MMDMLTDCGLFAPVEGGGRGNFHQLSGWPLSELNVDDPVPPRRYLVPGDLPVKNAGSDEVRTPSTIRFVRSRMLYARAALNAKGGVRFGMRHIRELNATAVQKGRKGK